MIRQRNIQPKSFNKEKHFPGTAGNPFDVILQSAEEFARLPNIVILLCLALLAWLGGKFVWYRALTLLVFFVGDWLLLAFLSRTERSYGPVKPVVLMLAVMRIPFALLPPWLGLSFQVIGTILVFYGFYIEPFQLDVHNEVFATTKFSPGKSIKIAHLGDLHIERITRREKQILRELEKVSPDLILFSGDILNLSYVHEPAAQGEAVSFLKALHAPLGVYGVTGSPPVDPTEVYANMTSATDMQWLDDEQITINIGGSVLAVTGLTCSHRPDDDFERLKRKGLAEQDTNSFNILLYHSPDIAPHVQSSKFDLQFSGHTHGGQVCLPGYGAIYAASLYHKAFEAGRYLTGEMTLYVTRGLGMEGGIAPRVRFLCRPELIFWEIMGAD